VAVFSRFQSDVKQLEIAADDYKKSLSKYLPNNVAPLGYGWAKLAWSSKWSRDEVLGKCHSKYGANNVEKLIDALKSKKADIDDVSKVYLKYFVPDEEALQASNGKPSFMRDAKLLTEAMLGFAAEKTWQASYITSFVLKVMCYKLCPEDLETYADDVQSMCLTAMEANKGSVYSLAECAWSLCRALEGYPEQKSVIISQYIAHLGDADHPLFSECISRVEIMDNVLSEEEKIQVNGILADKLKNLLAALPDSKDDELSDTGRRLIKESAEVSRRLLSFFARDSKGQDLARSFNGLVGVSELTVVSDEDKLLAGQLTTLNSESGPTYVLKTDLRKAFTKAEAKQETLISLDYKATLEENYGEIGKALARKLVTQTHMIK
jgi:hypothetical protein